MAKNKILFIIGSSNQTTQMHQISKFLEDDFDCYFTQLFSNQPAIKMVVKMGLLDHTIFAGEFKRRSDNYLLEHQLKNDYACQKHLNTYDLVVACTDMILPGILRDIKTIWIQEGMIDGYNLLARIVKTLKLPSYFAMSTALNGTTNKCDIYCAASEGYKNYLTEKGTDANKIVVTGIPNYDNLNSNLFNDFPHRDYVLVATSDIRETFRSDDRKKFLRRSVEIAAGRRLIFKLHPNEKKDRAIAEIKSITPPDTLIYIEGNTNHMIANCSELITQYSTVVYVGLVLGKKVHSYFDVAELNKLTPLQNNGKSAETIADICKNYISYSGTGTSFLKRYNSEPTILMEKAS